MQRGGIVGGIRVDRRRIRIATFYSALLCLLAVGLLASPPSHAQSAQVPSSSQPPAAAPSQSGQVQGYTLPPSQEAQAIAYASARHELYFFDVAYGILLLVMLLQLRVAPFYRGVAERAVETGFGQTIVFVALLILTIDVLSLPTAIWAQRLSLKYQQSIQGWGSWLVDWAKGEGVVKSLATKVN